jgi:flavin-binding protein dodecin
MVIFSRREVFALFYSEETMAKTRSKGSESVYRVTELVATSPNSWEEAARNAIETAAGTLRELRVAEVDRLDVTVEDGKVVAYRARVKLSFKYEG